MFNCNRGSSSDNSVVFNSCWMDGSSSSHMVSFMFHDGSNNGMAAMMLHYWLGMVLDWVAHGMVDYRC